MPRTERHRELRRKQKRRRERVKARVREMIAGGKRGKRRPAKAKSDEHTEKTPAAKRAEATAS
jgi:hypothetical protein